ncbi:MAG: ATP-binding domain-containing protein [Bacteroidales bacterium]|nr:ATP-binding domain-containing protein [Bacteroidales bacterium]
MTKTDAYLTPQDPQEITKIFFKIADSYTKSIENIKLKNSTLDDFTDSRIHLTTIHKTKGNEYPNIVYFNLSQDSRLTDESDIEEERRVTYVGVTRARESIFITALKNKPSMFLPEVAFNPELKSLSTVKLQSEISFTSRQLLKLEYKVDVRQSKKNYFLDKFPELRGKQVVQSYSLLANALSWWREKRIEVALRKIDLLEAEILQLTQDQMRPMSEKIEFLETEVQLRNKIPKK